MAAKRRRSKYGSTKTGGKDSKREYLRGRHLQLLERAGEISSLRAQVKFELIPKQVDENGRCLERACHYFADYVYLDSAGNQVVEDVKGYANETYPIKRKLMLQVHGIRIQEVR